MIRFTTIAGCIYVAVVAVHFLLLVVLAGICDVLARQRTVDRESLVAIAIISTMTAMLDTPLAVYYAYAAGLFRG